MKREDAGWDSIPMSGGVSANPAPGAAIGVTVPAGVRWKLFSGVVTNTTDDTVVDRFNYLLTKLDGTNSVLICVCGHAQEASQVIDVSFVSGGLTQTDGGTHLMVGMGSIELIAASLITIDAIGGVAGDDFTTFRYAYKERPL